MFNHFDDTKEINLKRNCFYSRLRSNLFKKVCKGTGGLNQWLYIVGKKNYYKDGSRIKLSLNNIKVIQNIVDYYNSTEGLEELTKNNISNPEHIDDVVNWVQNAMTSRELKNEVFNYIITTYRNRF